MIPPKPGRLPQRRTRSAAVSTTGAGRGMRCNWFDACTPAYPVIRETIAKRDADILRELQAAIAVRLCLRSAQVQP
jgi:hypothetical protein